MKIFCAVIVAACFIAVPAFANGAAPPAPKEESCGDTVKACQQAFNNQKVAISSMQDNIKGLQRQVQAAVNLADNAIAGIVMEAGKQH